MTTVITFYSYKGGVGRTMALVNTAYVFARSGWRVLMVDFDLEAPGMTHFFSEAIRQRPMQVRRDALDLLLRAKESLDAKFGDAKALSILPESLAEYVVPVPLENLQASQYRPLTPYANGRLDLLPATLQPAVTESGEPSIDYLQRMDKLNLPMIFGGAGPGHRFGNHVRQYFSGARFDAPGDILFTMRESIKAAYDVVLIDSRTGLNEVSGLSVGPLCDSLVVCCGLNGQNIEGTRYFMERAGLLDPVRAKPYIVAAGPVPLWHTMESEKRITHLKRELGTKEVVEIPYHPKAALQETVFVTQEPRDPISRAYETLSDAIVGRLSGKQMEVEKLRALERESLKSLSPKVEVAASVAERLHLIRLWPREFRIDSSLCSFPSAYTASSLAYFLDRESSRAPSDATAIALAAAISARRLGSEQPFNRARNLVENAGDQWTSVLAVRLLFFQLLVRQSFPTDATGLDVVRTILTKPQEDRPPGASTLLLDAYVTHLVSRRYAPPGTPALSFGAAQKHFDRLMAEHSMMSLRSAQPSLFEVTPAWMEVLPRAVVALTSKRIGKRERSHLLRMLKLVPVLDRVGGKSQIQSRSWQRRQWLSSRHFYEGGYWGDLRPVGLWPELLLAAATAVVRGAEAAQNVVNWLALARMSYGYAWRVMIDWAHLEPVKDEPVFQKFISEEDELVEQIEDSIDHGVYPL